MAENSIIAWTHNTFNPWIGCMKVSKGCENCYAETLVSGRMGRPGLWGPAKTTRRDRTSPANWNRVRRWNKDAERAGVSTRMFCASLCDVFEDHPGPNAWRAEVLQLIRETPFLQWQVLTKRPENIEAMMREGGAADHFNIRAYPNLWLGTSIEDMRVAARADHLRKVPAVVRFISYEPALGPLDELDLFGIDWILYGGESGPGYRAHDLAWPRSMRQRCAESQNLAEALESRPDVPGTWSGTTFFFKQSAAPRTEMGIQLDGEIVRYYPRPRSVDWRPITMKDRKAQSAQLARIASDERPGAAQPTDPRAVTRAALPLFSED